LSLWLCLRASSPKYMRSLPIYFFVNAIINLGFFPILRTQPAAVVFASFETCYFAFLLTQIIHGRKMIIATWLMVALYLSFIALEWTRGIEKVFILPPLFESCILIIPSLYYYWEVFKRAEVRNLKNEAAFWVVSSILVYSVFVIPVYTLCTYYFFHLDRATTFQVFSILNFVSVIGYCLFIKGMSCKKAVSSSTRTVSS
jgi:hypothetical protein